VVRSLYLWKSDDETNRVANVRYARGAELAGIPGVTGIGIGKDHIIVYVKNLEAKVPAEIDGVRITKIIRM
jgi:hypothetical protein